MQKQSRFSISLVLSSLLLAALISLLREGVQAQTGVTVLLPFVNMPATVVDTVVAQGRLTVNGAPLANTAFELRSCDDDELLYRAGVTDDWGNYQLLLSLPEGAASLSVELVYPATDAPPARGTLSTFESICVPSSGVSLRLPEIDLAATEFVSPAKGKAIDMPILFGWQPRSHPGVEEMYQVVGEILYDCDNCEPVTITAAALPHPSSSILLECVYTARNSVLSGEFRVMVSNASGVGYSDPYAFDVGHTERCSD